MERRSVERVLVVEDDATLRARLQATLGDRFDQVRGAQDVNEALVACREFRPELLVLDVALPDGSAFDVLAGVAELDTMPLVIAISGGAGPDESFELARRGVHTFLPKPIGADALDRALDEALSHPPDLRPQLRTIVGMRPIHEVEEEVREVMVNEALGRSAGNRRGAARLLSISRQLLQHILRRRAD